MKDMKNHMLIESFSINITNIITLSFISDEFINAIKNVTDIDSLRYLPEFWSIPDYMLEFMKYCYGSHIVSRIPKIKFIQEIENIDNNNFRQFEYIINHPLKDNVIIFELLDDDWMDENKHLKMFNGRYTLIDRLQFFGFTNAARYINYRQHPTVFVRDPNRILLGTDLYLI